MPSDVQVRAQLHTERGETILELPDGRLAVVLSEGWRLHGPNQCRVCKQLTAFRTADGAQAHPMCLRGAATWTDYEIERELERLDLIEPTPLPPPQPKE